jgi:hypothetical protein
MHWRQKDSDRGARGRFTSNRMHEGPRAAVWPWVLIGLAVVGAIAIAIAVVWW